ncbi:MAG: DUF2291 domain-containing protein [Oscillochloris sp.]|nr:DUF2291 domain-containing protein [Oscillochloris sp.]
MPHSLTPRGPRTASWLSLALLLPWMAACQVATIRPIEPTGAQAQSSQGTPAFNAKTYVESIWASKVVPAAEQDAVDLPTVLTAITSDQAAAEKQYGHREQGRPANFLVKGEGRVLTVDTSSRNGKLILDLPPYDQQPDVSLQIGPVLRGTAVRDAVGFIQFNQFVNQLEYADVANALNDRVAADVLSGLDLAALADKNVSFQGAFTLEKPESIVITPIKLAVGAQS